MEEKRSMGSKFLDLLLDVVHRWSGEVLGKSQPAVTTPAAPLTIPGVAVAKQQLVAITALMDTGMAEELTLLAQAMQTNESDVLARLIKIARMIREFGLYGVPTPDGNQLGIYIRNSQEVHKINLECPAQQNHRPPPPPPGGDKPPSHLN
jgi:hypothetical protein